MLSDSCIICKNAPVGVSYIETEVLRFVKCPECSLIWRVKPEKDTTEYNEEDYFETYYKKKRSKRINKSNYQLTLIEKYAKPPGNLLEIGCSLGYFLEASAKRGWNPVGTDISDFAINKCLSLGLNAHKLYGNDLLTLNTNFKVIAMKHVFEHISNPIELLSICHQLLEEKGIIFINIPDERYFKGRLYKEKYKFYDPKCVGLQHYYYYTPENVARLLEKCNFKVLMKCDLPHSILGKVLLSKEFNCIAQKV